MAFTELHARSLDVRDYGAVGDGVTLNSEAINAAILAAAEAGGGTVTIPAGEFLSYSIRLKSNVRLHLESGAMLIAANPPAPGEPGGYDPPEPNAWNEYQDFGHSHWHNSLIWGEDLINVSITGQGMIYGRGLSRGNGRIASPVGAIPPVLQGEEPSDVLAADGVFDYPLRPDLTPGPFGYPNARDTHPAGVGNKSVALKNCRNVLLRDFTILHGGHFGILATGVDNLTIDNLTIDTNRDGMNIDACSNVRISNCRVNAPWDDGICLKSSHGLGEVRLTENVTIINCALSGYDEGSLVDGTRTRKIPYRGGAMGRIKLGTESGGGFRNVTISNCTFDHCRGIALEQVDGGILEDVSVSNITMRDVQNTPIFIRLGARLRRPDVTVPGKVRRILIDNVIAWNVAPEYGVMIAGLPGYAIEDVVLSNLQFHFRGGGTEAQAQREIPELARAYPEPYVFGVMPSWGLFARNVRNLKMRGVEMRILGQDARPAVFLEDVEGANFAHVDLSGAVSPDQTLWRMRKVHDVKVRDCTGLPDSLIEDAGETLF